MPIFPSCLGIVQPHDALTFDCVDEVEVHRVFTDPVILFCDRQNQSIKRPALYMHIPGTSPHFRIQDHSVSQPNLINKCSSPVPQQSQMRMLLCGTEQSDKDRTEKRRRGCSWPFLTALDTFVDCTCLCTKHFFKKKVFKSEGVERIVF